MAAGALIASVLIVSGTLDGRATAPPPKLATAAFLAAFHRSLEGTYVVEADFTRRKDDGATMTSGALVAQAPPDHLTREFGGINGAIGGRVITCSTSKGGQYVCAPSGAPEKYSNVVDTAMTALRDYFRPPVPLYTVVRSGSQCFDLTQVAEMATAPYGIAARMCFDATTGAMSYLRESLEGATDTFSAVHIRSQVTGADFSTADDDTYNSTYHDGPP